MSSVATAVEAIKTGEIEKLRNLIDAEPTFRARGTEWRELVMLACYYRRPEAAEASLNRQSTARHLGSRGAGERRGGSPICRQQPELIHAWSPDGFQPLHLAAFFGQPAAVQALLNLKADVNAAAHNPMSVRPIHSAVAGRNHEVVRLLIQHGARLERKATRRLDTAARRRDAWR